MVLRAVEHDAEGSPTALTQLSRYLYENQSPTGALESAVLVLALWWVWVYATWVTNSLDPARFPVRAAVIGLALVGLTVFRWIVVREMLLSHIVRAGGDDEQAG